MALDISGFTHDDAARVAEAVEVSNAAAKVDSPWVHPDTNAGMAHYLHRGWDGEPPQPFLAREDGVPVAVGFLTVFERDNRHLVWASFAVHPDHRRRAVGSRMWEFFVERGRSLGRRTLAVDAWESEAAEAFAARHGLMKASQSINRRQVLADVDRETLLRHHAQALEAASDYELVRVVGRVPEDMVDAVVEMTAAINDAPMDDLDVEDEVFDVARVRAYEHATLGRDQRLYRLVARHRQTGELGGHTVVAVEAERPSIGHQHDTSVVRSHRGHRLGLMLKSEMVLWLEQAEPELATIDTWNAESNDHMIEVNEELGYRVLGRGLQFQRSL